MSRDGHGFGPPVSQPLPFETLTHYPAVFRKELIAVHHQVARSHFAERAQHL